MALASIGLALGAIGLSAGTADAATQVGGVSMWTACNVQWPGSSLVLTAGNVYGWKCRVYSSLRWADFGVDVNRECRRAYGNRAYSGYLNYADPYSWRCYR